MGERWVIRQSVEFREWFQTSLADDERDAMIATVMRLQDDGPALRRPLSGLISGSRYSNMKELIPPAGNIRILYAFDPARQAILLLGGDKSNDWVGWYARNIPIADAIYERHLSRLAATAAGTSPDRKPRERKR